MDDKALGMDRAIARRDFLNGVALTAGAAVLGGVTPALADATSQDQPGYYPPARTGLRGSHPGSFEAAHAVRDGTLKIPPGKLEGD
jgi:spermidine dehydrogenase